MLGGVYSGITWTAVEFWSVCTPTLKSLILYVDFKIFYYYILSDILTAAFLHVFSLMKFNSI